MEVRERSQLLNVVVAQQEEGERRVGVECRHLVQPVVADVEVSQLTEQLQPRGVRHLVVRAVQPGQAWRPLEGVAQPPEVTVGHTQHPQPGPAGGGRSGAETGGELGQRSEERERD